MEGVSEKKLEEEAELSEQGIGPQQQLLSRRERAEEIPRKKRKLVCDSRKDESLLSPVVGDGGNRPPAAERGLGQADIGATTLLDVQDMDTRAATLGSSAGVSLFLPASQAEQDLSGLGRVVAEKEVADAESFRVSDVFSWLEDRMTTFCRWPCRVQPTGKVFPLPSSRPCLANLFPNETKDTITSLRCVVLGLNSLNGEGLECTHNVTKFQEAILDGLLVHCRRTLGWEDVGEAVSWEKFFKVKGVDYKGEEVLSAQKICWENVATALPVEVGGVPLHEVVEKGSRNYVLNFDRFLLEPEDQTYVRPPRVMVDDFAWEPLCANLLRLGVFDRVHEDEIYQVNGKPLLNGLFWSFKAGVY